MLKPDTDTTSSKVVIGFKCGECLHFEKVSKFEKPCSQLGVTRHANSPGCFSPNVYLLQKVSPDIFNQLGLLLRNFTSPQARVLLALLRSKKAFDKYNLAFGQPVFFHLGDDFLSNYFRGFVFGVVTHGEPLVYVTSDMNKRQVGTPGLLMLLPSSVYTVSAFRKKRQQLLTTGRKDDPKPLPFLTKAKARKPVPVDYEPPTMESVPDAWFDAYARPDKAPERPSRIRKTKTGQEFKIRTTK